MNEHDERVHAVAEQTRALAASRQPAHIDKGGVHHVVPLAAGDGRFAGRRVDVSALRHVLEVDTERRRCVAEPGVTFRDLLNATLPHGLAPAIVPELEGITVGGAVAGCSVESASFRYGGFHDTCLAYEVVTGTGEVIACSPEQEPLLFGMIHGSYGTLAVLTRVSFALVPAMPYVHVEYRRFRDPDSFHEALLAGRAAPVFRLKRRPDVVCDYFIPAGRVPEFYSWYLRELGYFPLWVVPYRVPKPYPWLTEAHRARAGDLYVDLAVYGMPNGDERVD